MLDALKSSIVVWEFFDKVNNLRSTCALWSSSMSPHQLDTVLGWISEPAKLVHGHSDECCSTHSAMLFFVD